MRHFEVDQQFLASLRCDGVIALRDKIDYQEACSSIIYFVL